jgi:hypothetical protein
MSMGEPTADDAPPRAKGRARRRTDAEIDALARVSDADEAPAKARWHRDAPRKFKGLIDATEAEE